MEKSIQREELEFGKNGGYDGWERGRRWFEFCWLPSYSVVGLAGFSQD